jgi:hypothetical protein
VQAALQVEILVLTALGGPAFLRANGLAARFDSTVIPPKSAGLKLARDGGVRVRRDVHGGARRKVSVPLNLIQAVVPLAFGNEDDDPTGKCKSKLAQNSEVFISSQTAPATR